MRGEPTTLRPRNDPPLQTPAQREALDRQIEAWNVINELSPEEFKARKTNLMVRLAHGDPTNHLDVLLLKRLLDEANEALEDAQEKHDAEIAELKDDLAHIRNYPDC